MSDLNENFGRTIQLFLVDGKPTGLRKATIHGWTGLVFVSNQSTFASLTSRYEVDRSGVYILIGPDPDDQNTSLVYIGSANSVKERIKQSAERRAFWEVAISITTSDDDLSKGHAEYLEARLIELTKRANRVKLDNGTSPDTSRRRLPEADVANMEQFLANLGVILPVVGLNMLKPQPRAVTKSEPREPNTEQDAVQFEIRHKSGVKATGVDEDGEFVILEGSEALTESGADRKDYDRLKDDMIDKGILRPKSKSLLEFVKPYAFKSPSAAASIVLDRNSNGRTEWKVRGEKQTYHEWQQAQADAK